MAKNPYKILGVAKEATPEQIKKAYKKKVKEVHPDTGGDAEQFGELQISYDLLKDAKKRARYDETGEWEPNVNKETQFNTKVHVVIATVFDLIISNDMYASVDIVEAMRSTIKGHADLAKSEIESRESSIKKFEKIRKRIKSKTKDNILHMMLDKKVFDFKISIENLQEDVKVHDAAIKLLKDLSCEKDPAEITRFLFSGGKIEEEKGGLFQKGPWD